MTERARDLLDGITPGPWIYSDIIGTDHNVTVAAWDLARCTEAGERTPDEAEANATFIAAAPVLVADLVAEVEKLRSGKAVEELIGQVLGAEAEADAAAAAIERVRALDCGCPCCCATVRALDWEVGQ
ncbi:hypothetical protein ACFQNE_01960 [Gordonia phosphorivorans]|uniref:HNH endonuclease n=1 Tax=Gordonia phosphorivorans TaxID=1056982 RepID=A0ABV6H6Q1_9ACTN